MSVIFRIRPAGLIDGATVPVITGATQDPDTGIYDVEFNSFNSNFGVLDVQELFRVALGNASDDFLIPQLIVTDGPATGVLELSKLAYNPGGAEAGINRELLWSYLATAGDEIGPKPFLNYTGQRLICESDNPTPGEGELYVVAYPVSSGELLDAICCTTEASSGGGSGGTVVPARAILPIMDTITDSAGPGLSYKAGEGDDLAQIIIQGSNLTGITTVDVNVDVRGPTGSANTGPAPVTGALVVNDDNIVVPLDCTNCDFEDMWGIVLTDGDGNVYGAPSPVKIYLTS